MLALILVLVGAALAAPTVNPYSRGNPYINPFYQTQVGWSISRASGTLQTQMRGVQSQSTFVWLDRIAAIQNLTYHMDRAKSSNQIAQLVIYDLPNRDCAALASNGELLVASNGLSRYKSEYIDPIAKIIKTYTTLPAIVLIIEPDSLANLATNLNLAKCSEANTAYRDGVAYAITNLYADNVYMYLDIAHECWLGWDNNRQLSATVFQDTLSRVTGGFSTGLSRIRGFAANVANYCNTHANSGDKDCGGNNPCIDEASYIAKMIPDLQSKSITGKYFLIDTSRNGKHNIRSDPGSWCNVKGAGIGARPRSSPDSAVQNLDAFVWIKPPGESDGTTSTSSPRFDAHCANSDATAGAPEAGDWFYDYFSALVTNAVPSF